MPDTFGSMGCSTPVGYRSRGDSLRLPSPAGPMSCRRSQSTSLLLGSTYITSGPAGTQELHGAVIAGTARERI